MNSRKDINECTVPSNPLNFTSNDIDPKYKFNVQKPFAINSELSFLSDTDDDEDIFIRRCNSYSERESERLLNDDDLVRKVSLGQAIDQTGSSFPDFISYMDKKIEKECENIEARKETLDEVVSSLTTQVIFPVRKVKPEEYGSVCSFTWKHCLLVICFVAVILPVIYFIYFYNKKHT